jgi:hypothetical protein
MIRDQIYCNKKNKNLIRLNKQVVIHFFFAKANMFLQEGREKEGGKKEHVTSAQSTVC